MALFKFGKPQRPTKLSLSVLFTVALVLAGAFFFFTSETIFSDVAVPLGSLINLTTSTTTHVTTTPLKPVVVLSPRDRMLANMRLTFNEDFNTLSRYVDATGNVTCSPGGTGRWQTVYQFCSRTSPANLEAEIYIDQNFIDYLNITARPTTTARSPFSIKNGILAIEANPSDAAILTAAGSWAKYTSGLLTTQYSFSQLYGYFEIRAKLPKGEGLWPAFWLLPADKSWPPEIDIFEAFGGTNNRGEGSVTHMRHASHALVADESCGFWRNTGVDLTAGFHTYGVDWEPSGLTYYFDSKPYATCKPNSAANKPFFILINLAVGGPGSWPGEPESSNVWPANMYVDYVRAYQKK